MPSESTADIAAVEPGPGGGFASLAVIEVGGSSTETVVLRPDGAVIEVLPGATTPAGLPIAIAVPGDVVNGRVERAVNLGWEDVDPAEALGVNRPGGGRPLAVVNDASAAAAGECWLRPGRPDLVFIGLGTGIGGAVVRAGKVVTTGLFGHEGLHSETRCNCGRVGCLETVAAGWALPVPLDRAHLHRVARAVARAVADEPSPALMVVAGGLARAHPELVDLLAVLTSRPVEPSAAPTTVKSAAAFGILAHLGVAPPESTRASSPASPGPPAGRLDLRPTQCPEEPVP